MRAINFCGILSTHNTRQKKGDDGRERTTVVDLTTSDSDDEPGLSVHIGVGGEGDDDNKLMMTLTPQEQSAFVIQLQQGANSTEHAPTVCYISR